MKPIIKEKKGYSYDGITYDSKEEIYFAWWLQELTEAGYIIDYDYHCDNFLLSKPVKYDHDKTLKTKTKTIEGVLLAAHFYQPDFKIIWSQKAEDIFYGYRCNKNKYPFIYLNTVTPSFIDIKGEYEPQSSKKQVFSMNQKWMWQEHSIFVQKIVPKMLFLSTFHPSRYNLTDISMKPRKGSGGFLSLNKFITLQVAGECGL